MAPFLLGYKLAFGSFPYLPDGPVTTTPFILGVLCLLASERVPGYSKHQEQLVLHVEHVMKTSPAGSWTTFDASREDGKLVEKEDRLDPELGIGPEEIVGASVLAMHTYHAHTRTIFATSAFRWARGWIKVSLCRLPQLSSGFARRSKKHVCCEAGHSPRGEDSQSRRYGEGVASLLCKWNP